MFNFSWDTYKDATCFGITFVVLMVCCVIFLVELGSMFLFQSDETLWEGVCSGTEIVTSNSSDSNIALKVNCPGRDEFEITTKSIIVAYVNEDRVFFCEKTKGNIMKNESWFCHVPGKSTHYADPFLFNNDGYEGP